MLSPDWERDAARRLAEARVLLVGAGGLGSPAALALAAAGVGTLTIVDFDRVDESNLQRQVLYDVADVGRSKVTAAARRLSAVNDRVRIEPVDEPFSEFNGLRLVSAADVVVDGTDSFASRYLVNDACVLAGRPNVFGSVARFDGQLAVFAAPGGPCYRCLHPEPPPDGLILNCADAGVLGVLPGAIGWLQAVEAIKLITGMGESLVGRLLLYDALRMKVREISLPRDPSCPICGDAPTIRELRTETARPCAAPESEADAVTSATLRQWRASTRPHRLIDVREPGEHAVSSIDGAVLIPLGMLGTKLEVLPRDRPIVVHCETGQRSARAVERLRAAGFDARNLTGGIRAWLAETSQANR